MESQVFSHAADLVPVAPGWRWRLDRWSQLGRGGQLGNDRWIGRRQLEPLADRAAIDAELAANRPRGGDVLVQRVCLSDARHTTCQTPPIASARNTEPLSLVRQAGHAVIEALELANLGNTVREQWILCGRQRFNGRRWS